LGGVCDTTSVGSVTDSLTVYEADGVDQTARAITFGRFFSKGEFSQCLQPVVGGMPVASYQVDVKNRWSDNSVKIAVISFIAPSFTANSSLAVTFQPNSSCNNTGYLTQSQMVNFNSGDWGASMEITANGTTRTTNAATMLNALTFADCKLQYWLQGPVVTAV